MNTNFTSLANLLSSIDVGDSVIFLTSDNVKDSPTKEVKVDGFTIRVFGRSTLVNAASLINKAARSQAGENPTHVDLLRLRSGSALDRSVKRASTKIATSYRSSLFLFGVPPTFNLRTLPQGIVAYSVDGWRKAKEDSYAIHKNRRGDVVDDEFLLIGGPTSRDLTARERITKYRAKRDASELSSVVQLIEETGVTQVMTIALRMWLNRATVVRENGRNLVRFTVPKTIIAALRQVYPDCCITNSPKFDFSEAEDHALEGDKGRKIDPWYKQNIVDHNLRWADFCLEASVRKHGRGDAYFLTGDYDHLRAIESVVGSKILLAANAQMGVNWRIRGVRPFITAMRSAGISDENGAPFAFAVCFPLAEGAADTEFMSTQTAERIVSARRRHGGYGYSFVRIRGAGANAYKVYVAPSGARYHVAILTNLDFSSWKKDSLDNEFDKTDAAINEAVRLWDRCYATSAEAMGPIPLRLAEFLAAQARAERAEDIKKYVFSAPSDVRDVFVRAPSTAEKVPEGYTDRGQPNSSVWSDSADMTLGVATAARMTEEWGVIMAWALHDGTLVYRKHALMPSHPTALEPAEFYKRVCDDLEARGLKPQWR